MERCPWERRNNHIHTHTHVFAIFCFESKTHSQKVSLSSKLFCSFNFTPTCHLEAYIYFERKLGIPLGILFLEKQTHTHTRLRITITNREPEKNMGCAEVSCCFFFLVKFSRSCRDDDDG